MDGTHSDPFIIPITSNQAHPQCWRRHTVTLNMLRWDISGNTAKRRVSHFAVGRSLIYPLKDNRTQLDWKSVNLSCMCSEDDLDLRCGAVKILQRKQMMDNCSPISLPHPPSHCRKRWTVPEVWRCRGVGSFKVHGTFPLAKIKGLTFNRRGGWNCFGTSLSHPQ